MIRVRISASGDVFLTFYRGLKTWDVLTSGHFGR